MKKIIENIVGPARDIYQKAGWVELKIHPGWFVYNLPADIEQEKLDLAIITLQII